MAKEIYRDDKRVLVVDNGRLSIKGRVNINSILLDSATTDNYIPTEYAEAVKKMGENPDDKFAFYQYPHAQPIIMPMAAKATLDAEIKAAKLEKEAIRNDPGNIERNAISKLYADAERIYRSGREDNVETPMRLRSEAEQRLKAWRVRYPEKARKEDSDKLIAKAEHEEEMAIGALTYDADGSLSPEMQQKRHDEFISKAKEYRKQAHDLLNPPSPNPSEPPEPPKEQPPSYKIENMSANSDVAEINKYPMAEIKVESKKPVLALPSPNLERIESQRSKLSQSQDASKKHSIVVLPANPKARRWVHDQGSMDILGIDTPKSVRKANSFPKARVNKPKRAKRHPRHPMHGVISHYH